MFESGLLEDLGVESNACIYKMLTTAYADDMDADLVDRPRLPQGDKGMDCRIRIGPCCRKRGDGYNYVLGFMSHTTMGAEALRRDHGDGP